MDSDLDTAPVAPAGSLGGVPIIDLERPKAETMERIADACRDWGFFQIVGHGVAPKLTAEVIATARAFFALPRAAKRRFLRSRDNPWGYYDRELTKERRDKKEIFDIGPDRSGTAADGDPFGGTAADGDPFEGTTPWPDAPASFEPAMRRWRGEMERVSDRLVALIAGSLTGDAERLRPAFLPTHTSYLRLNHYPVEDHVGRETGDVADLGIHHHTDAGALTVLLQDGIGGLQLFRDGMWHDVAPVAGGFTINIGDMVQVWSNDRYRAPVHRVLAMEQNDRISIPYFYNPSYQCLVEPLTGEPHYAPIPWGEFRRRRADGDFADYGTEVQIAEWRLPAAA